MDDDLSPHWTSLNIVKAIKSGLFLQPPAQHTIERISAARVDNHAVTSIIEEHKLFLPVYNCTYVYVRTTTPYYLGCMSVSLTKYMQCQLRHM